jgi:hypothetical protein
MIARQTITIEVGGKLFSGTYSVAKEFLSVSSGTISRTTIYHGVTPQRVAKMLLRQIALKQGSDRR